MRECNVLTDGSPFPDRTFRDRRFEALRSAYESGVTLSEVVKNAKSKPTKTQKKKSGSRNVDADVLELLSKRKPIPPYEFFQKSQELEVPGYLIETAVSGRSKCVCASLKPDSISYCKNINVGSKMDTSSSLAVSKAKVTKAAGSKKDTTSSSAKSKANFPKAAARLEVVAYEEFGKIALNSIRIGSMVSESGTYGRFKHLSCWRVPKAIWFALPQFPDSEEWNEAEFTRRLASMNEVIFCGFNRLTEDDRSLVAKHTMDQSMWASFEEKKFKELRAAGLPPTATMEALAHDVDSEAIVIKKENSDDPKVRKEARLAIKTEPSSPEIALPLPNVNGAMTKALCRSAKPLVFVLTGVFPMLGGGIGLNEGKDKAAELIRTFGGVVRSAVSGKTDILLVGEAPGVAKLAAARSQPNIRILNLEHILDMIHGRSVESKPLRIDSFSTGFRNNSLAYDMTRAELDALRFGESITAPAERKLLPQSETEEGTPRELFPTKSAPPSCANSTLSSKASHTSRKREKPASIDVVRRSARIARGE